MLDAERKPHNRKTRHSRQSPKPGLGNWLLMYCSRGPHESPERGLRHVAGNDLATDEYYKDHAVVSPFRDD